MEKPLLLCLSNKQTHLKEFLSSSPAMARKRPKLGAWNSLQISDIGVEGPKYWAIFCCLLMEWIGLEPVLPDGMLVLQVEA